jgi:hypothetical protein
VCFSWLYNVTFSENYFFFWDWRCVDGFAFPDVSKGHSVYIIKVKQCKKSGARWLKSRVITDLSFFSKSMELHNQQRVVTPQNNSAFRNIVVRTSVSNSYSLIESPVSLLHFVMYSRNLSTSRPTIPSSNYKFSLSLNHSITHLLTPFLCHSHLASPSTHLSLTHTDFLTHSLPSYLFRSLIHSSIHTYAPPVNLFVSILFVLYLCSN